MQLIWRDFYDLSLDELYDLLQLRADVFVLEQHSLYRDIDGADRLARHLLARGGDRLVGGLRLCPPPTPGAAATIGRVVLAAEERRRGQGARMLEAALAEASRLWGAVPLFLSAQVRQRDFYARFGFVAVSDVYDDAGVAHIDMRREAR